jgi:RNA polymerase sigma factor (sigma-70 family)
MTRSLEEIDPLLLPFVQATTDEESESLLADLISNHADQIVKDSVRYRLRAFRSDGAIAELDVEDLHGEVMLSLISRLRELRNDPVKRVIASFRSYVRVSCANACAEHFRRKLPLRNKLHDKLRYVLTHRAEFAMWKDRQDEWLCGLANWRKSNLQAETISAQELDALSTNGELRAGDLTKMLGTLFELHKRPLKLDDLLLIAGVQTGIKDQISQSLSSEDGRRGGLHLVDTKPRLDTEVLLKLHIDRLWTEINELPIRQRCALLMNLTDGEGRELTSLLETIGDLLRELPLNDASIAQRLSITRQQVINLRKSARERLARKLKGM